MTTKRIPVTDADFEKLAEWAEAGFDPATLKVRPGRPSVSSVPGMHSPRMATRVSPVVRDRVLARAASEGKTPSQAMRQLLEGYAAKAPMVQKRASRGG